MYDCSRLSVISFAILLVSCNLLSISLSNNNPPSDVMLPPVKEPVIFCAQGVKS